MTILLFPGRHLLQTAFQEQYLRAILNTPLARLHLLPGTSLPEGEPVDTVIFTITSANHQYTRYNPIPFHIRAIGVDRFARDLATDMATDMATDTAINYRIFGIPHYAPSPRFAMIMLKEIAEQTENELQLSPANTIVLTSTMPIAGMFQSLGFAILPAEAAVTPTPPTPQHLLSAMIAAGTEWASDPHLRDQISPSTQALWRDFPEVPRRIFRLWHDPLLTDEGSLTETRNYTTYAQGMSNDAIIDLKYRDIQEYILPGRIVDEGCADGALLVRIARHFPDSDLIGLEITGELISRCHERQRAGEFGEAFVHFHQRNITTPVFQSGTIHTTICNSTLHELWSYNEQAATVSAYLAEKFRQTAPGGRLLIRDVVGPERLDTTVYLWLTDQDGAAQLAVGAPGDVAVDTGVEVAALSTFARFFRFAADFLPQRPSSTTLPLTYTVENISGTNYIVTTLRLAVEYITKKDYLDNWDSEMHEEFAFWSFPDWQQALQAVGFAIHPASHVYTNPWIVENRWQGQVALFERDLESGRLIQQPFPPTTVILVADKPKLADVLSEAYQA